VIAEGVPAPSVVGAMWEPYGADVLRIEA
jgi:hypothetical protein